MFLSNGLQLCFSPFIHFWSLITIKVNLKIWFYPKIVDLVYFFGNKIFSYCDGVWVRGEELIQTIREKYLFSDSLAMRLSISMEFLMKIYPTWLRPNLFDLTVISVLGGYIAGCLWHTLSEMLLLSVVISQIINQHLISDQKRPSLTVFLKNIYQKITFNTYRKVRKRFLGHNLWNV